MDFIEVNGTALRYDLRRQRRLDPGTDPRNGRHAGELGPRAAHALGQAAHPALRHARCRAVAEGARRAHHRHDGGRSVALMDALDITGKVALAGIAVGGAIALHAAVRVPQRVAAVVASSPAIGIAPDRRPAVLARVERMEREGLRAVLDTLDSCLSTRAARRCAALCRFSRPLARQRSGELCRHLPHARRHGPAA